MESDGQVGSGGEAITTTEAAATFPGLKMTTGKTLAKSISQNSASAHSRRSSVASRKRLLEAQALRRKAEIERQLVIEKALVDARLQEELAALNCSDVSSTRSARTRQWVNDIAEGEPACGTKPDHELREPACEMNPDHEPHHEPHNNPPSKSHDDMAKLTNAITEAIRTASTPSSSKVADKLLGRLSARDLPSFSGDPLDWLRFKNAFHTTTRIGEYTEEENISRLQRCLHGEAWEAVSARLLATTSATDVMNILEMRFGRPDLILTKLIADMRRIPKLSGARAELVVLATKVDNCVAAIQATGHVGYLYSPDLTAEIISKLTEPIFYRWLDYSREATSYQPQLPILAKYLVHEAQEVCKRGGVEPPPSKSTKQITKRPILAINAEKTTDEVVLTNSTKEPRPTSCVFCDVTGHQINACDKFKEQDVNQRWEWICKRRLCFRCLKATHRRDRCKSKVRCSTCKGNHHKLLHRDDWTKKDETEENKDPETTANIWSTCSKQVFLKVLPVTILGPEGTFDTCALLDEGSTVSLVESNVAKQVGARGRNLALSLQGAVGSHNSLNSQIVSLSVVTDTGNFDLEQVRTVENLTLPKYSIDKNTISQYDHLRRLPIKPVEGRPTILIGQDYWHLIVTRDIREGGKNEPVASLTELGWVLHGVSLISRRRIREFSCHIRSEEENELHLLVENYFELDSLGIKNSKQPRYSPEEKRALHILDTKSRNIGDRWESALLWRTDEVKLPNNKRNAENRLRVIEKIMDSDPSFAADYTKQVDNMLEKDYARKSVQSPVGRVWYLPHFGVRNVNKPGKLRLVFDAKAETQGVSLNTELLSGPDLLNSLLGVLLRFREREVAVTADIREMFLQIKINSEDQNAQCFLWRGMERKKPPAIYQMTSMTFGATSSPCTATYIIRRNADDFASSHPRAVEAIKQRHYVDDYLDSVDNEEEMKRLVNDVIMIHKAGGFDIRNWASNRPNVLPSEHTNRSINLIQQPDDVHRTLGMNWKPVLDVLGFDIDLKKIDKEITEGSRRPTKREMLKVVMSIFDPLGILCPLLINGKIMLQEVWRSTIKWDEQISEKTNKIWHQWMQKLKSCKALSVPRCYGFSQMKGFSLHVFVDASEQAYAAVAYLTRDSEVAFVAGKCRVAPLKSVTIPKLELQAAVMGARLGHTIQQEHKLDIVRSTFWTDSQTVWKWIRRKPRKPNTFVSNRLTEIDELTNTQDWRWVPGSLNVADEATRENQAIDFSKAKWITGPDFLRLPEVSWPTTELLPETEEEECEKYQETQTVLAEEAVAALVDYSRFSNWRRLKRCVAYVFLFLDKCRRPSSQMTPEHERRAEIFVLKQTQADSFNEEIAAVRMGRDIKPQSRLRRLNPYLDENGLLRLDSRLEAGADLPQNLKTPIILDARHYVVKLLIKHQHRRLGHYGTATLINELRQTYYILRLRNEVRSLLARCTTCKIRKARCIQPMMAGLPQIRLHHHCRPFSYCGIDLFGPMQVTIGRRHEKRWGVLFTCLSVRAVHIELASSLSMDSTVMAIRRMAARRGWPKRMHSDNGTNFKSADKEMKKSVQDLLNSVELRDKMTDLGVEWTFNPPEAPHMGGVWERLVRSIKTALAAVLFTSSPKEEILTTLMMEAENMVNSRPITHVSLEPHEEEALTPNHFLLGSSNGMPALGAFTDDDLTLRKQWRVSQRLADHFWSRWLREYLPLLQERKRWPTDRGHNVDVGDLVVIADASAPRNVWPKGRVVSTIPGRDGRVRMVDVLTRGGTLRRPVTKLVLLMKASAESAPT